MKTSVFVVAAWIMVSCTAFSKTRGSDQMLVGLWEENSPSVHAITLRKSDGTYRRKVIQDFDYAKPAISYQCTGFWKVSGKYYVSSMDSVSAEMWKKDIGKRYKEEVRKIGVQIFTYFSTDGAMVEERKIGGVSDVEFDNAVIKPLGTMER